MKTIMCLLVSAFSLFAADAVAKHGATQGLIDSSVAVVDDVRFETADFHIDSATNTATIKLTLTNLNENPRELKINVYGTQLIDDQRTAYYFSTIELGRVLMRFADNQNYLHYLLQPNTPVQLTITAEKIASAAASIQVVKVVFEDRKETGRFLDAYLTN